MNFYLIDKIVFLLQIIRNSKFCALDTKAVVHEFFITYNEAVPSNWLEIVGEFPRDLHIEK